jgi:hypothetical protein
MIDEQKVKKKKHKLSPVQTGRNTKSLLKNHGQPRCIARYMNVYKYGEQKIMLSSKIVIY